LPDDEDLVCHAPAQAPSSYTGPSSSTQPSYPVFSELQDTLHNVQVGQAFLRAFVACENPAIRDFVKECYDELQGMIVSQN